MSQNLEDRTSAPEGLAISLGPGTVPALPAAEPGSARSREFDTGGLSLRGFAARGIAINTGFNVGLTVLQLVRGFALAAFLTRTDYGVFGVLAVTLGVLSRLKIVGVGEKYIQQDELDQELAFQHAFTMEAIVTAIVTIPLLVALPVVAVAYGHWNVVPPGAALLLVLPAGVLQVPLWTYYRRMRFLSAGLLQAIDPVVGFVATLAAAILGAGYWSFAIGALAAAWSTAAVAIWVSPYPLRLRYDKRIMRVYLDYSWPLLVTAASSLVLANSATLATNATLGLAGVGAAALAANITLFTNRVDDIVSSTLFPAICAVKGRVELWRESFTNVNRLALMWAMPFGVGVALFCGDLVRFGLGARWHAAVQLLQITGVVAAIGHIGFNWDDYYRADGNTRPVAVASGASAISFVLIGVPLTLSFGLRGLAGGIAVQALVNLAFRSYYLNRMFHGFAFMRHAWRAIMPTVPAVAVVLLMRLAERGHRTFALALVEFVSYVLVTAGATWLFERRLLHEAAGYMLERRRVSAATP
jgi:PST family polysaccharide transporter